MCSGRSVPGRSTTESRGKIGKTFGRSICLANGAPPLRIPVRADTSLKFVVVDARYEYAHGRSSQPSRAPSSHIRFSGLRDACRTSARSSRALLIPSHLAHARALRPSCTLWPVQVASAVCAGALMLRAGAIERSSLNLDELEDRRRERRPIQVLSDRRDPASAVGTEEEAQRDRRS